MPLRLQRKLSPVGEMGIWSIEEDLEFFLEKLELDAEEQQQIRSYKGRRQLEWLAGRHLLHLMSGRAQRGRCYKDEFGKPHLEGSDYQISISHSHGLAAVIAAPVNVGIDIQLKVEKIERIAHKFMRPEEMASLHSDFRIEHLHLYWGAKEALYKAYGRRQLDFRAHIHISPFSFELTGGAFGGQIFKDDFQAAFRLQYELLGDYLLVYGLETGNFADRLD